jgi:hypothetical protein
MRYVIGYLIAAVMLLPVGRHAPDPADDSLRLYAVNIVLARSQSWTGFGVALMQALAAGYSADPAIALATGYGIYLGQGLIVTAAHVVGAAPRTQVSVRFGNLQLPAKVVKEGAFEQVDLTLLAVDQEKLPISLRLRRMPLCHIPPGPGEPVIVAVPEGIAPSTIMSPRSLPANLRTKFPTVISDVATTGDSGSGVFDERRKCLLGIMSRKIFVRPNMRNGIAQQKDIAKYFVPAATITAFIPNEYRY